ncbi:MAG TPA: hypothetical protein VD947_01365 [Patescibacteria group bacterium]|nr:hypothetical protein [Patescibacteria group bacterium]
MSFMKKFRRRDDEESENLSLYNDEPTGGRLASVLFGFFALFITLLIAGALFFGGRAVYRALTGGSDDNSSSQNSGSTSDSKPSEGQDSSSTSTPSTSTPSGDSSNQGSLTQQNPNTGDTPAPSSVPSAGDTPASDQPLPRTGDEGL